MNLCKIPYDINIELVLSWLPEGSYRMEIKGQHKRNAYNDLMEVECTSDNTFLFHICRNGLYNALPEYLFHPLNRFSNLPPYEEKERFAEELEKQEHERVNATKFFEPLDLQLMLYRVMAREKLRNITETNSLLTEIIGDRLSEQQKKNRFIVRTVPFISHCRYIRGNKTLLTQMLRKVMMDEGMRVSLSNDIMMWKDESPRYADCLGYGLGGSYLGNVYDEKASMLEIEYWPEILDENFPHLLDELEEYRSFISDFFVAIEELLMFRLSKDGDIIILGDRGSLNYLNYNTNL